MPKRKVKRTVRWGPVLTVLLIVNCASGLAFSRITSMVRLRVEGWNQGDQVRIRQIAERLRDVPCSRIDARAIESDVMSNPEVDRAEMTRNIFGNALLTVSYRTPVARLLGNRLVALSSDGVLYRPNELPGDLPTLQMEQGVPTLIAYAGVWRPSDIAYLASFASQNFAGKEVKIEINEAGVVWLNIGSGSVKIGSCNDLSQKLRTLTSMLQKDPLLLDEVKELNLILPTAPTTVPKTAKEN